jgi:hypothetical protein
MKKKVNNNQYHYFFHTTDRENSCMVELGQLKTDREYTLGELFMHCSFEQWHNIKLITECNMLNTEIWEDR